MKTIDQYPAAPLVRIPLSQMPSGAAAYTDGCTIFIPIGCAAADERTMIRHESAHIWLRHFTRRGGRKFRLWAVACEMEIARNIYDDTDLRTIADRSSILHGAYLPDSVPDCPDTLRLAEEIYDWLMTNDKPITVKCACKVCDATDDPSTEDITVEDITAVRGMLDELCRQTILQKNIGQAVREKSPPSLASEMDALFRTALVRERTYKRPPRTDSTNGFIERGRSNLLRSPRVQIYVDRSGSFTAQKTAAAQSTLSVVCDRYRSRIKSDVFYFGADTVSSADIAGGGNTPYHLVVEHINRTVPAVVIVLTDGDAAAGCGFVADGVRVLVVPIDCSTTDFAAQVGGLEIKQ